MDRLDDAIAAIRTDALRAVAYRHEAVFRGAVSLEDTGNMNPRPLRGQSTVGTRTSLAMPLWAMTECASPIEAAQSKQCFSKRPYRSNQRLIR